METRFKHQPYEPSGTEENLPTFSLWVTYPPIDPYEEDCESDMESDTESWENQLKRLHKSFTTGKIRLIKMANFKVCKELR
ncbi:uncharacterized protein [Apostichopus japonicus]|uniref:uncharacterized protein isoform X2 n=1 Tax=Stichopus japonicus TaxID=307972 RepID=UPI003AB78BA7